MPMERKKEYHMKKVAKNIMCRKLLSIEMGNYLESDKKLNLFKANDETYNKIRKRVQKSIKDFIELDPEDQDEDEQASVPKKLDLNHKLYYGTDSEDSDFQMPPSDKEKVAEINRIVADSGGNPDDVRLNNRLSYCFGLEDMLAFYGFNELAEESESMDADADYGEESEEEEMKASEREVIQAAARNRNLKNQPVDEAGLRITDDDMEFEDSSYSPSQDGEGEESESDLTRQLSKELAADSSASAESSNKSVKILEFDDEGNISPKPKKKK